MENNDINSDFFEKIVNSETEQETSQAAENQEVEPSILESFGMNPSQLAEMAAETVSSLNDKLISLHARITKRDKKKRYEMADADIKQNAKIIEGYFKTLKTTQIVKLIISYNLLISFVEPWEDYLTDSKRVEPKPTPDPGRETGPGPEPKQTPETPKMNVSKKGVVNLQELNITETKAEKKDEKN